MTTRTLLLADGTSYTGEAFGADRQVRAEAVFTTGMTGYQETLTDQSYNGQIVTFSYPLIGNTGINRDDMESLFPTTAGVICREYPRLASNWRNRVSLDEFLKVHDIPGLAGIDTRSLVRRLRTEGVMKGVFLGPDADLETELESLRAADLPTDQVAQVSTRTAYPSPLGGHSVVLFDFGLKHSILRELAKRGCAVTVVPHDISADRVRALAPDGIMLSNGPGDPKSLGGVKQVIRDLQEDYPIFGICLGHQLLCLANGADTFKLPFGHRGFNHPVKDLRTGRIDFTSQNHGFAVDPESIPGTELEVTQIELNDGTVEGIRHTRLPAISVQYHPDAAAGPHDAEHIFDDFIGLMDAHRAANPVPRDMSVPVLQRGAVLRSLMPATEGKN
ncbi:carbamoyl-phosphate synthase small subunit [Acidipropionibacterium acidipropionici]|jgi:carbamoyl-phosphate synthase small subunit|uniref:Carbamoyl phosphate synthase small chain n=1 Tax=Acidipropionibacterium acidipropionici TaxID=1748 RepID=A0AAC8YDW9_9ACTN|nr:carbamoyl phosphate synthase small subunit [Acidipropionibacterium acidipropionici]AMS04698.1 carbamoyl-phosphate synthase small subunit [Acidipropionibacterium acidipropionici]AOZ46188.1 carbamoyl phosphate synthase small subunit [Acidipropionibacterium acidipropionici]AZP37784.1 carbamoyl-phosphate synthase small subunit [Acidipropionibacterium acidipropionici]QCV95169.1 glutamine-hydrolyzing carbamoyl-phosphate synthase small subunit [Acidipropionibacterium acidipropionici]